MNTQTEGERTLQGVRVGLGLGHHVHTQWMNLGFVQFILPPETFLSFTSACPRAAELGGSKERRKEKKMEAGQLYF